MEISGRPDGQALAAGIAGGMERLVRLFRSIKTADGLALAAPPPLATLERSGPSRLTSLAVKEGVTQPAMTQLIVRLQDSGLVERTADPSDGRVVQVRLTDEGRAILARRRAVRAERLAGVLAGWGPEGEDAAWAGRAAV